MAVNINPSHQQFDIALRSLASVVTTPEQLEAVEAVLAASEETYCVASMVEVARFFGVEEQTVRTWRMRADSMPGEPGKWPLDEIAKWLTRWRETPEQLSEPKPIDVVKHRLAELDLAEREKRLIDVSEITPWLGRVALVVRDGITQLEQRYGSEAADIMRTPLERLKAELERQMPGAD